MAHLINLSAMILICLICQICQRVRSVRPWESDLWGRESPICEAVRGRAPTASQIWESDRPLTHTGRSNAFRIGLSAAVRERPIGLSNLWGRGSTASHHKVMWSVWESEVRGRARPPTASHGLTDRTLKSVRPICEADLWGRESPIGLYRAKQCV